MTLPQNLTLLFRQPWSCSGSCRFTLPAQVPQRPHCICPLAPLRVLRPPPRPAPLPWGWEGAMAWCVPDGTCLKLPSTRHFQKVWKCQEKKKKKITQKFRPVSPSPNPQDNPAVLLKFSCCSPWPKVEWGDHMSQDQRFHPVLRKRWWGLLCS